MVQGYYIAQDESNIQDDDYIIEAYITNDSPFVGEQVLYVLRYYAYIQSEDVFNELPDFGGFWLTDVYEAVDGRIETIGERQYIVKEIFAEISPLQEGQITITPSYLEIPETVFRETSRLGTEPIQVNVQSLPEPAPPSFRGAVGTFNARIEVDPLQITLGEPVTLTMTIDGTGNLEQFSAPFLPEVQDWRIYSNPSRYAVSSIGGLRFGQKVFEWLLIPERAGTQVFPPILVTYFDPQLREYVSIEIDEFSISVLPGEGGMMELPTLALSSENSAIVFLRSVTLDEANNHNTVVIFRLAWFFAPVFFLMTVGFFLLRKLKSVWYKTYAQRHALQRAKRSLSQLRRKDQLATGKKIQQIILTYFSDRFDVELYTVDRETIPTLLIQEADAESLLNQVDQVFDLAEILEFAPAPDPEITNELYRNTLSLLQMVDNKSQ